MFYWKRNIGRESELQAGLSLEEIGVLTILEDHYISTESPLGIDWLSVRFRIPRRILENFDEAGATPEQALVLRVLSLAFNKSDRGWERKDLNEVLSGYWARAAVNARNASRSKIAPEQGTLPASRKGIASDSQAVGLPSLGDGLPNHKPLAEKLIKKEQKETGNSKPGSFLLSEKQRFFIADCLARQGRMGSQADEAGRAFWCHIREIGIAVGLTHEQFRDKLAARYLTDPKVVADWYPKYLKPLGIVLRTESHETV